MDIGDTVLHPRYGVGIIGAIETRMQDGKDQQYYVIPKPSISSTIFVPVEAADEVGLRPLSPPDILNEALEILKGEREEEKTTGLRDLKWSNPLDLASAIHHQVSEPKSRYPKVSELHQLKRAKKLLAEEISAVLGLSDDCITALIDGALPEIRAIPAGSVL